jgi:hypothetical protein
MTVTPTQLSLRHLRDDGWTAEVVEHWNPHARIRQDLFGFVDILALRGPDTLAVQTTTVSNVPARVRKIAGSPLVGAVREAGWLIHVHGWRKKAGRWELARNVDVS